VSRRAMDVLERNVLADYLTPVSSCRWTCLWDSARW